jgi:hypothetical protein
MSKFPSKRLLAILSPKDREFFFLMEYEDIKAEITGLVSGYIKPPDHATKENQLGSARLRLQALQKLAAEFKINL